MSISLSDKEIARRVRAKYFGVKTTREFIASLPFDSRIEISQKEEGEWTLLKELLKGEIPD